MQYDDDIDDLLIETQIGQNLRKAFPLPEDHQLPERMASLLNALRQKHRVDGA